MKSMKKKLKLEKIKFIPVNTPIIFKEDKKNSLAGKYKSFLNININSEDLELVI